MDTLVFELIKDKADTKTAHGFLKWGTSSYNAISGGHGNGYLPEGVYTVKTKNVVVGKGLKLGFQDSRSKKRWFIPIVPDFDTGRNKLGIHPDGGKGGTLGCIGLRGADTERFWKRWNGTPLGSRPRSLIVRVAGEGEKGQGLHAENHSPAKQV